MKDDSPTAVQIYFSETETKQNNVELFNAVQKSNSK